MYFSLKLAKVFSVAALALCVPLGAKSQSLEIRGYSRADDFPIGAGYEIFSHYPEVPSDEQTISASDGENYVFRSGTGEFAGSTYEKVSGAAGYGTLHAIAYSDLNDVNPGVYGPLSADSHSDTFFNDSVYLAPTAGYAIGTPITLSARMDITASLTASSPKTNSDATALYAAAFSFGSQGLFVQDIQYTDHNDLSGTSTGTLDAFIGDTVSLEGQLSTQSETYTTDPGQVLAKADVGNTAHFYLSAPGVSIIGMSGHDYTPPAAVPEASTTISFGLLLGLGGVIVAVKRRKASGKASA